MGNSSRKVESEQPKAATLDVLTQIWERVLRQSHIGPEERLYDLGANDRLADEAFAEMSKMFGRPLPSATVCYAPTLASLATLLERPALPRFPPFVKLKEGVEQTPIFIAPGVGGRAKFAELAQHIRTEHTVYGIQAKGVDGMDEPFDRVEDMAAYYLGALLELQPIGPYILIGYSFGGLIALEMAQRLNAAGKGVALLTLLDTYPHPRYLPVGQRLGLTAGRIERHLSDWRQKPLSVAFSKTVGSLKKRLPNAGTRRSGELSASFDLSFAQTTMAVKHCDFVAMKHYRPRFYPGKINFVRPEFNSYLPTDPTPFWKKMSAGLEIETVPGDHVEMVASEFKSLAAVLTRYVSRNH